MYSWKTGSRISADADVVGGICEKLSERGQLSPENLLEQARSVNSPIHGLFEWDDAAAAEQYRRIQARHLIANLTIVGDNKTETRAFVRCTQTTSEYTPINVCLSYPDMTERLLSQAYKDMRAFQAKYKSLEALAPVLAAMEEVSA